MKIEYIKNGKSLNIGKCLSTCIQLTPVAIYVISPGPISKTILVAQTTINLYNTFKKLKEQMPKGLTKEICIEAHEQFTKQLQDELKKGELK